ncbi:hypothetical protein DW921_10510 [Phocaeicola coprophilus]|uniref:Uncharacterized protein n=1 Tax=Phocaeicola coprophilus TaxID=387090 RepID=A0A413SXX3_9BACT|nr:hypothetical protein DW921_10510 [Phocaeicola coprophilus]
MKCLVNPWSFPVFLRFVVQRYCGREKHQVPLTLSDGGLSGSLPQFVPNWVFRKVLCPHTCLILPDVRSEGMHVKRFSRPRSSKGLHKREKNRIRNHQKYLLWTIQNYPELPSPNVTRLLPKSSPTL